MSLINRINFSHRLILFSTFSAVFVALSISIPTYLTGKSMIFAGTEDQIELIRESKRIELEDYFAFKITDIKIIRRSVAATKGFIELRDSFERISKSLGNIEKAREEFRKAYIFNNPNPKNQKQNLLEADKSDYSKAHAKIMPYLNTVLKERGYYDIFLVDSKTGEILFTVMKEDDYMTNLLDGKYRDANIGKLFRTVINSSGNNSDVFMSNYEPYAASNNEINTFLGSPVIVENKLEAVLIFQLPIKEISEKVRKPLIEKRKEISYLVGPDYLLRTDIEDGSKDSLILKKKIESEIVKKAISGEKGSVLTTSGFSDTKVFSSYSPLDILGNKFALIIELDYDLNMKSYTEFQMRTIIITISVLILILVLSFIFSKSLSSPVQDSVNLLSTSIREISSVIDNHERTASMQSASVNETTTTLNNIANTSKVSAEETLTVTNKAKEADL